MTKDSEFPKLPLRSPVATAPEGLSQIIRIRLRKEDSAYVYAIFEANDGIAAYSTLEHRTGELHRDLEFIIPLSQIPEMKRLLDLLKDELHGHLIYLSESSADPVRNP